MAYVSNNPKFITQLYRPQSADPSNPAEGMVFRSDGTSRSKGLWEYREGNWQRFGSDAKTYIANYNIDSSTTSWATYADAAGVVPVNGTGGVATTTFTFSSSSPLRGSGSGIITKDAANRQGEGISADFTIDTADQGKVLQLSFDFTTSSAFVAADYRVFLYDVTNSLLIEGNARDLQANAGYGLYIGNFQTSSNSTSYRLILHCATTNASAYTIKVDNFIMSPSQVAQGAIITDWQAFTPTGAWSANTSYSGYYRRVGDSAEVIYLVLCSGAPTSASLTVNLPSGLVIDTAKIPTEGLDPFGEVIIRNSGTDSYSGQLAYNNTTSISVLKDDGDGTLSAVTQAAPFTFGANDYVKIKTNLIPIAGWSSSITVPSQQTNQVIAFKASLTANQAITSASPTLVTFNTVSSSVNNGYDTAGAFDTANSRFVAPESGSYYFAAHLLANSDVSSGSYYSVLFRVNETSRRAFRWYFNDTVGQWYGSVTFPLVKGDRVDIVLIGDASYNVIGSDGSSSAIFEGFKVQGNQTIGMDEVVAAKYTTNAGATFTDTGVVVFEDKEFDTHGAYDIATGIYTCPIAGKYLISAKILLNSAVGAVGNLISLYAQRQGGATQTVIGLRNITETTTSIERAADVNVIFDCLAGDTIRIVGEENITAALSLVASNSQNYISIARIK